MTVPSAARPPAAAPADSASASAGEPRPDAAAAAAGAGAWQRLLAGWLAAHKAYPDEARRRHVEGSVVLRFTTDRSGRVLDVAVVGGSGSAVLDGAAQAMVRDATLPPFTAGMPQDRITVTVQIRYALTD